MIAGAAGAKNVAPRDFMMRPPPEEVDPATDLVSKIHQMLGPRSPAPEASTSQEKLEPCQSSTG